MKRLRYIKFSDILAPFIFILILPISLIYRLYLKIINKKLWLICEDGYTARDNGYYFYRYIRTEHPKDFCFYVIDKKSSDYNKVKELGNIINFKSFKHWLYYLSASKNISIHKHGNPCQSFFYIIHVVLKLYNNRIFLQHGVIKDDLPFVYYKNARFRLFICSAKREYEYVKNNFGYPKDYVVNTGLARFDSLHNIKINNKQILFMPTWRNWFGGDNEFSRNKNLFKKTEFYQKWNSLLNNKELIDYIEKENIIIYFYPHQHMKKFLNLFSSISNNIKIVDNKEKDIQDLLKVSALLVTDYSSVFMDFGYMNKPIIYYQFDEKEFREKHLQKGYFDYRKDGFGEVITEEKEISKKIIELINNNYQDLNEYETRRLDFFEVRDTNNCKRTYEKIKEIEG